LLGCGFPDGPGEVHNSSLHVYFLNVKQGDACLMRTPGNSFYLFDTGNEDEMLVSQLLALGVDTLRAVFLSHPDFDHYASLTALIEKVPVKRVFLPPDSSPDPTWRLLMDKLRSFPIPRDTLYAGDTLLWDSGVKVRVLWPAKYVSMRGNNLSLVLRVDYFSHGILLTGDAEDSAEARILASQIHFSSEILKVSHHGSRSSSTLPFLAAVSPHWAVISCDSAVYGHPHPETLAGLRRILGDSSTILRTDREGAIAFEINGYGARRLPEDELAISWTKGL
jgi:competence protein ComEC